ncbi:DUF2357 domain-containing protein [Paraclostridium bifermentans]|uniref:DUF2357 domain-containing protein n=1 Tax=Paraclostridium bifermentans TaxID=1490 RepID=UPI00115887EF|nr:DUF2357 domain-containing protein [Paraclostridium bifermentans]TQO58126.1 DUF2357 domain-containing protein [Paraclostridium bifermentans]
MDTQIKLAIHKSYCRGRNSYIVYESNQVPVSLCNDKNRYLGNEIFSIKEYDRVELELISDTPTDILEIECYASDISLNNSDEDELVTIIKAGEKALISSGCDSEDMLVPGDYVFRVKHNNFYYDGTYRIKPSTANWESILTMREKLEELVYGLSYNIYLERKGYKKTNSLENDSLIEKLRYLEEVSNKLLNTLQIISRNPLTDIQKEYEYKDYSRRSDSKSQRWLCKKGPRYNDFRFPTKFFEKHSNLTHDITENKTLKSMLEYIYSVLTDIDAEYLKVLKSTRNRKVDVYKKINELRTRYDQGKYNRNLAKSMQAILKDIHINTGELRNCTEKENIIKSNLESISRIKNSMAFYIRETWLNEITETPSIKITSKLMKNKQYSDIYNIYTKLKGSREEGLEDRTFPHKKTSKLFEIYNYLVIKDILEDFGFKWTDGWIKDVENPLKFNGDLESGEMIKLSKDSFNIKMIYDKVLNRSGDIKGSKDSEIVAPVNVANRRPDILIEIYDEDTLIGSIVAEVKYRKKFNLYNTTEDTDAVTQLISYRNLEYHDGKLRRVNTRLRPINKVIALYPFQNGANRFVHDTYDDIVFVPILPLSRAEDRPYGYDTLKEEIKLVLEDCGIIKIVKEDINRDVVCN